MAYKTKIKKVRQPINLDIYRADLPKLKRVIKKLEKGDYKTKERVKLDYWASINEAMIK